MTANADHVDGRIPFGVYPPNGTTRLCVSKIGLTSQCSQAQMTRRPYYRAATSTPDLQYMLQHYDPSPCLEIGLAKHVVELCDLTSCFLTLYLRCTLSGLLFTCSISAALM